MNKAPLTTLFSRVGSSSLCGTCFSRMRFPFLAAFWNPFVSCSYFLLGGFRRLRRRLCASTEEASRAWIFWDPGLLTVSTVVDEISAGRGKICSGLPLSAYTPGRLWNLLHRGKWSTPLLLFESGLTSLLDFGALELFWMNILRILYKKVHPGATKDYNKKGTIII